MIKGNSVWIAVTALCAAWSSPAHSQSRGIVANDAVVLPADPARAEGSEGVARTESEPTPVEQAKLPAPAASSPAPRFGDVPLKPAQEDKPLGAVAAQSAVDETGMTAGRDQGILGDFDPRRNEITRVIGALAVVIGLLLLVKVFMKRAGGMLTAGERPSGVVEILARFPVSRGQQLILLKLGRRLVLLHHAGSVMTPISEVSDASEVASLLSRMEAGSTERGASKFRQALNEFQEEHEAAGRMSRARTLPKADTQVIDLTRRPGNGIGRILGRRSASSK